MVIPTLVMGTVALLLVFIGYYNGHGQHITGMRRALQMTVEILPLLVFALIIAGMTQVLLSQEFISKWVGSELGGDSLRPPPSDARPHSCFRKKAMGARPKLRNSLPPFSPHCFALRSKAVGVRPRGLTPLEPPLSRPRPFGRGIPRASESELRAILIAQTFLGGVK